MAVAERTDKALVNIYDAATQRRRKTLQYAEIGSKEVRGEHLPTATLPHRSFTSRSRLTRNFA